MKPTRLLRELMHAVFADCMFQNWRISYLKGHGFIQSVRRGCWYSFFCYYPQIPWKKQQTKCASGFVINLHRMFNKKTSCFDRCQSSAVIVKLNVWITKTWTAADLQEALLAKFPMFCFIFMSLVCSYCVHLLYHLLSFVTLWSTFFFPGQDWLLSIHYYWFISL